jgi:hypothetical protein
MNTLYVRPSKPGLQVCDPESRLEEGKQYLPEGGAERPRTSYWLRRVRHGDVVVGRPKPQPQPREPKASSGDKKAQEAQ